MLNADRSTVARHCVGLFDKIQYAKPEEQLLALAASFLLLSEAVDFPAQDAFTATKNLMADPLTDDGIAPQFSAMRFHLKDYVLNGQKGTNRGQ